MPGVSARCSAGSRGTTTSTRLRALRWRGNASSPRRRRSPDMTRVSVVIPTYNCASRLVRALQSVAAQTYSAGDIELVVIDDGSSDDTEQQVAAFAAHSAVETRY